MSTTGATVDVDAVRAAVGGVPDPELPVVTLAQLGMVHDVRVEDGAVTVELLPTFSGCPATEMMGRDVRTAVGAVDGVTDVTVRWLLSPAWTTDRISAEGHEQLRSFGIAPPTGGFVVAGAERPVGARSLPVVGPAVSCPYCGSRDVVEDSPFGPTPCRASWYCSACTQPFERFKPL